jgi:signal peptidase
LKRIRLAALLIVPALVLGVFVLALSGLLPFKIYAVQTGSMSPTIPPASAVFVKPDVYHVGQPISFYEHGSVVTHRLMAVHADGTIETKGDANATIDPWHVSTKDIIGEVVYSPPMLGYWLVYLRNPLGLLSILIAALGCWQIWAFAGVDAENESDVKGAARGRTNGRRRASKVTGRRARSGQPAYSAQESRVSPLSPAGRA